MKCRGDFFFSEFRKFHWRLDDRLTQHDFIIQQSEGFIKESKNLCLFIKFTSNITANGSILIPLIYSFRAPGVSTNIECNRGNWLEISSYMCHSVIMYMCIRVYRCRNSEFTIIKVPLERWAGRMRLANGIDEIAKIWEFVNWSLQCYLSLPTLHLMFVRVATEVHFVISIQ